MNKQTINTFFCSGGASGIGLTMVKHYMARGADVAIFDLRIPQQIRDELSALAGGSKLAFYETDVCNAEGLTVAAAEAAATIGAPDLALNSAGIQIAKPFAELTAEQFTKVINVNLIGSRNFAAAVLAVMQPGSHLALVASLAGFAANHSYAAYNASKFGVVGLAAALRIEMMERDITVSAICPPEVMTPMVVEEQKTLHPIAKELKAFAGTLTAEDACAQILQGLDDRKSIIIPGFRARMVWRLARFFPGILEGRARAVVKQWQRQSA